MPRYGVSITKSVPFRNSVQEFSNVYYYEAALMPDAAKATTIINNLVTLEKTFHSTAVNFVRGRLWSQLGDKALNNMIQQSNLSGTGARPTATAMDYERAFLFRLRAGNDSRGNPVYLRKWYHACGAFNGTDVPTNAILQNTTGFSVAQRDAQVLQMQAIGDANGSPDVPKLCAKSGRLPDAGANFFAHAYLEHHQMGDMWRSV
jgi:hypothetical protein